LLEKAKEWYLQNKQRLVGAAEEIAAKMALEPTPPPVEREESRDFSHAIIEEIKRNADPVHGGFGNSAKFPHAGAISLAFAHHHATGDQALLAFAEKTLHNMSDGLLDSEEGGLFRYSVTPEWNMPHYEKNLSVNAECLQNYIDAYRVTGKREYADTAEKIIRYVQNTLSDRERGGFYGSQDADIFDEEKLKIVMEGEHYYKLSAEDRKKRGVPFIDKTIYTNWNAFMISSYLEAYHALGREDCRDFALTTLQLLMDRCFSERAGVYHYLRDGEASGPGMLADAVALARANLDAYETTGDRKYLEDAERLMGIVTERLSAPDGGFCDSAVDEDMPPATRIRHKSMNENALAAEVLARLFNYTAEPRYLRLANSTLSAFEGNVKALLARGMGYLASKLAIATRYAGDASTKVAVVGSIDDRRSLDLFREAKRIYRPAKMVQLLEDTSLIEAMNYPVAELPVAHVCTEKGCAAPIREVEQLRRTLESG
jgi:uncharacterized protein YyaL (SSP411 family)